MDTFHRYEYHDIINQSEVWTVRNQNTEPRTVRTFKSIEQFDQKRFQIFLTRLTVQTVLNCSVGLGSKFHFRAERAQASTAHRTGLEDVQGRG